MKATCKAGRWLALLLLLAACAGELNTPGEALRLLGSNLQDAFLGEEYGESLRAAGGLRPYSFELTSGELPPGLALEAGIIRGTPLELGSFTFTVTASDGNLSSTVQEYRLRVVELPPVSLDVVMPQTEVRTPFTIRVSISEARELLGFSTRLRWDPDSFSYVEGSLEGTDDSWALFAETGDDWLQVDLAWLAASYSGERQVFTFQLEPSDVARPGIAAETVFVSATRTEPSFTRSDFGARLPGPRPRPVQESADGSAELLPAGETEPSDLDGEPQ